MGGEIVLEIKGQSGALDTELIQHAATAVMHFFSHELKRTEVGVDEFAEALEKVMQGFGMTIKASISSKRDSNPTQSPPAPFQRVDLHQIASEVGAGFELFFFSKLREEARRQLDQTSGLLDFCGLRECVKLLLGTRRWSERCQSLSDEIVEALRRDFCDGRSSLKGAMVVR